MKEFFEYLQQYVRDNMPNFKTVELYNNQIFSSNVERTEKAFPYPAVFIELIIGEVQNRTLGIKDTPVNVVFHFAMEGYQFNHSEDTFDVLSTFDSFMQSLRSDAGPYFSSFQSLGFLLDTDASNVVEPTMTYMTLWRQQTAHSSKIEHTLTDIEVDGEII
jgi:hypothetical protein